METNITNKYLEIHANKVIKKYGNNLEENVEIKSHNLQMENNHMKRLLSTKNRISHLRKFCQSKMSVERTSRDKSFFDSAKQRIISENFFYSDSQRTIYCAVPKVACTSWKRMFLYFNGNMKNPLNSTDKEDAHQRYIPRLSKIQTFVDYNRRLTTYYSFLFVRNPFDRLLSAYRNKFLQPDNDSFRRAYGEGIYKIARPSNSSWTINDTFDITFDEFVTYVINIYDRNFYMNEHWQGMSLLCQPCSIKYDFIGKMDTLIEDSNIVLDDLDVNKAIRFKTDNEYKVSIKDIAKEFYSTVSNEKIAKIYEVYRDDFEAFDYDVPSYINDIKLERKKKSVHMVVNKW